MKVIKDGIYKNDIFLLILGRKYGSIDPTIDKIYTHIKFKYLLKFKINKALFISYIEPFMQN